MSDKHLPAKYELEALQEKLDMLYALGLIVGKALATKKIDTAVSIEKRADELIREILEYIN